MNLKTKKILDDYLGWPVLLCINALARLLGIILRRNHASTPVNTILIMKFQGMGSLVIAKPAIHLLRRNFPKCKIIFWGTQSTCVLAREMPEFDLVLSLDDRGPLQAIFSMFQCLSTLWRQGGIDWSFDLEVYSKFSAFFSTLSCARNRTGFVVNLVKPRQGAYTHLVFFNRYEYLGRAYGRLFGILNKDCPLETSNLPLNFGPWKFELSRLEKLPQSYIVLNLHAGDLSLERKWPLTYFTALAHALLESLPETSIILIGKGTFETEEANACANALPHPRLINMANKLTLQETIKCLSHARLVVSNDSAPLHLALSLPPAVLGLFGPTRPASYFPDSRPNAAALTKNLYCSPCVHHWEPPPCQGDNQCMKTLSVEEVLDSCSKLLGESLQKSRRFAQNSTLYNPTYYEGLIYTRI